MKPAGLVAIETEMVRQGADALASFAGAGPQTDAAAASLRRTGRLALLGMGASHAVNRMVEPLYRGLGLDAVALPASEQLGSPLPLEGRTVILASQSGESAEVVRWLATARAGEAFGLTLDGASTLGRTVPSLVAVGGPELAFAGTRSLTLTLALHLAILARLGLDAGPSLDLLRDLPEPNLGAAVAALAQVRAVVASGRRLHGIAEACALGLCELSRAPAFALEGGQLHHGPMEIMGPDLGVVLFAGDEPDAPLVLGMARSVSEAGAQVVLLDASGSDPITGVVTVALPRCGGMVAVLATLPAMQRLMLGYAAARVEDVGTPRRSSKITRTEQMRPLATLGNVNVDLIMGPTAPWPQPGTEVIVAHDELRPGGAAGNAALAWAGLGVPFTIASNVGRDAFGQWLSDTFRPHSDNWTPSPTGTTISVGLSHPGDERTFLTTLGHLPALSWDDARAQLDGLEGGLLLVCGTFLTDRLTAEYPALFAWAESRGIEVALDPGWPVAGWTRGERTRAAGWLASTRHLLVNEVEAMALSGASHISDALGALAALRPLGATVVVKAGPEGAHGRSGDEAVHALAPTVQVVDTIGAGDVFNAGYLLAVADGAPLARALEAGVALASQAIATSPRAYAWPSALRVPA